MANLNVTAEQDHAIVDALLQRNQRVTQQYLYIKLYPLFKSIYDNYYTDCQSCVEFINEIYLHLLTPNIQTGICKLQTFQFSSTLATWIKTVAIFYCYEHYRRHQQMPVMEQIIEYDDRPSDRFDSIAASVFYEEGSVLDRHDVESILNLMPNRRYSTLIRLRYLEGLSNEDTAEALQMNMDNFYNKHMRAKKQFCDVLKMEQR